jgi:hypothetical protein
MPQLVQLPGLWQGLRSGTLDLGVGGLSQLEIRLTNTPHNASWTQVSDAGFVSAVVANHFADEDLVISAAGNDIGGDGKEDVVVADKDFVSVGNPTGPFQYIYVVDSTSGLLLGYVDLGAEQTVTTGQSLQLRSSDASDRYFSISS